MAGVIERQQVELAGLSIPVYSFNTVVVGSGAAGLNCAARLCREMEECGDRDAAARVAVVTEGLGLGTSHNAGSDKQTYYKLGTDEATPDTALELARTLTAGGCMHGDVAMAEAVNSLRCFHHLVDVGVPFPHTASGGFVGYKTDFDPCQRATSAGPWTSRFMVRKLLADLRRLGVRVFERHYLLAVITGGQGGPACGLLCGDMGREDEEGGGLALFNCRNVVVAGGGPGELYEVSVYPKGQMGPYAALLEAGAVAHNLTELQFGLASLEPRWNLSGTYQQVIPRYYSTDAAGGDVREFLNPWFGSMAELATSVFLKGYQWPFDPDKVPGSSLVDVLVQHEMMDNGRRVFMDFTRDPVATDGLDDLRLDALGDEAKQYLEMSGALQATPIERLAQMNQPSIDLYREMGVDLWKEPLEVGVCCQHCNGGFTVDRWWESTVPHLFVIGELAGTHGVKRPGGSALNSGQVGGLRAAQRIAHVYHEAERPPDEFRKLAAKAVARFGEKAARLREAGVAALDCAGLRRAMQHRMSAHAGMARSAEGVQEALEAARTEWRAMLQDGLRQEGSGWLEAQRTRELALAGLAFLEAAQALIERGGGSRGSHLILDPSGRLPHPDLGAAWRFRPENVALRGEILTVAYDAARDAFHVETTTPRAIPEDAAWFENAWAEFREGAVFRSKPSDAPRPYAARGRE